MPEVLQHTLRKAKKQHHCKACRQAIEPGESYWDDRCADEGQVYTWRWCKWCCAYSVEIDSDEVHEGEFEDAKREYQRAKEGQGG